MVFVLSLNNVLKDNQNHIILNIFRMFTEVKKDLPNAI